MVTLQQSVAYLRLIGMIYDQTNQNALNMHNLLFNLIYSMPMIYTSIGMVSYFIVNISNLPKATEVAYVIFALFIYLPIYWIFVLQKNRTQNVMDALQYAVDQSTFFMRLGIRVFGRDVHCNFFVIILSSLLQEIIHLQFNCMQASRIGQIILRNDSPKSYA